MKVLKFGAVWCNGCLVMRPRWQEIERVNPWLSTVYYDFDTEKKMVATYGITDGVLPVFVFLNKNGKEIVRLSGEVEKKQLLETIMRYKDQ